MRPSIIVAILCAALFILSGCMSRRAVTVLDDDRNPVQGARVSISGFKTHEAALTDDKGHVEVELWEKPQWVTVEAKDWKIVTGELPPGDKEVVIILRRPEPKVEHAGK